MIEHAQIPLDLTEAVLKAHYELVKSSNNIVCAERSSAAAEDLGDVGLPAAPLISQRLDTESFFILF